MDPINVKTRPYNDLNMQPVSELENRQVILIDEDPQQQFIEEKTVGTVTTTYIGKSPCGMEITDGTWLLKRVLVDTLTDLTIVQYANGNAKYDKVWNDRASYDYK